MTQQANHIAQQDSAGLQPDPADAYPELGGTVISQEELARRIAELAAQVSADYADKSPVLIGVLKGAVMVMADLVRHVTCPIEMDWMAVASYGSGTRSSGVVRILKDLDCDIQGRHVLVVEDMIDSGLTLSWLLANLSSRGPASVELLALMRKPKAMKVQVDAKYVGFDMENDFVVGYGLDFAERFRELPFVARLGAHMYEGRD